MNNYNSGYLEFAEFYDSLTDNVDYNNQQKFIINCVQKYSSEKPDAVLDAGCGTGSLTLLLADEFKDVIGADPSEDMLQLAQQKALKQKKDILFLQQSLENLDLYGKVDLIVSTLDTINHITNSKALQTAFNKISSFLTPDGLFIFDTNSLYKHEQILSNNVFVYEKKDVFCVWQNFYNEKTKTTTEVLDFFKGKNDKYSTTYERYFEDIKEKYYSPKIIEKYLKNAGLKIIEICDDYQEKSVCETTQRITYVAKKC